MGVYTVSTKIFTDVWTAPLFCSDYLFYINFQPRQLVRIDSCFQTSAIQLDSIGYLFEWNGLLHVHGSSFIDINSLNQVEADVDVLKQGDAQFITKNDQYAIFKVVDLVKEQVRYFYLDRHNNANQIRVPRPFMLVGDKFISKQSQSFSLHELGSGNELWSVSFATLLPGKTNVYSSVVVNDNKVFFVLSNISNSTLVCLDASTGTVIRSWENLHGSPYLVGETIGMASGFKAHIINTKTLDVQTYDLEKALSESELNIHWQKSVFTSDGLLYFIDGVWGTSNKYGIIDLKNQVLLFQEAIPIKDGINNAIDDIHVRDGWIYLHTSDETLHVHKLNSL